MQEFPNALDVPTPSRRGLAELEGMREELLAEFFPAGGIRPVIGWSKRLTRRSMGCYHDQAPGAGGAGLILLNPLLALPEVPDLYVRYVVYHEILHAYLPPVIRAGRTRHHHRLFRIRERELPEYEAARSWEIEELPLLTEAHCQ